MRSTAGYKTWQILYPIGVYYVMSSIVYFVLSLFIGSDSETYMIRQLICAAFTIPVTNTFFMQDKSIRETVYGEKKFKPDRKNVGLMLYSLIGAGALGIAANNIIAMTPLMQISEGFTQANESFFAGAFLWEILGSCLIIPVAEELLFRGVVYNRIRLYTYDPKRGARIAIMLSAAIFGLVHFNMVQFIYATILGMFLAYAYEISGYLIVPIIGHISANTIAVIREETGWLSFGYYLTAKSILLVAACIVIAAFSIVRTKKL